MRIETRIADDFTEQPVDPEAVDRAVAEEREDLRAVRERLDEEPNELDRTRLGRLLNRLGEHEKLRGNHDRAADHLREAVEIWRDFDRSRAAFLAELRLADVQFARGDLTEAIDRADRLAERSDEEPFEVYRDFALELRGRLRARLGDQQGARRDLERTLELRRRANRDRLAARVERLLQLV